MKNPKNSLFILGATAQCHTRANGGNPPKRARQLAHCLSVVPAPGLIRSFFKNKWWKIDSNKLLNWTLNRVGTFGSGSPCRGSIFPPLMESSFGGSSTEYVSIKLIGDGTSLSLRSSISLLLIWLYEDYQGSCNIL